MYMNNHQTNNNKKTTFHKKLLVTVVSAAILVGGTVGVFATGNVRSVFGKYFKSNSEMNDLHLSDGGNVEITTNDDTLDVRFLGVINDGETAFSAIEVSKKDGSPIIDEDFYVNSNLSMMTANSFTFSYNNGEASQTAKAMSRSRCTLSEDNKTLNIFSDFTRSAVGEYDLTDLRRTYDNNVVFGYKLDKILYSEDLPVVQTNDEEWSSQEASDRYEKQLRETEKLRKENGLTEEECIWTAHEGKNVYAKGEYRNFDISFTVSFDFGQKTAKFIEREINTENSSHVVNAYARNTQITISPLGIYLKGECDSKNISQNQNSCFALPDFDGSSKVVLNDGTVYYILINEGGEHRTGDNGIYYETVHLDYSPHSAIPLDRGNERIFVDLDKIQTVIINGDTIYQK